MLLFRYIIVAGFAYVIDFGGFIFFLHLNYSPLIANVMVKIIAAIFGFYAHRYFTYSIVGKNNFKKHAIRYFGLALLYTPISSGLLYSIIFFVHNPIYAKAISDVSLFIVMFFITSKFAFIKEKMADDTPEVEVVFKSSGGHK